MLSSFVLICESAIATTIAIEPLYPKAAVENCIEGDVTISYKVSDVHTAIEIKIVKSEPIGIFDESTIKSMKFFYDKDAPGTIKEKEISWRLEECKIKK